MLKVKLLESDSDCDVSGLTMLQISNIIFDSLSATLPQNIQMTSELMDAASFVCYDDFKVLLSPIYYIMKGVSFYGFGENYIAHVLKTSVETMWIDMWFSRHEGGLLLVRRDSPPVRKDMDEEEDESEGEEEDMIWFTGLDHELLSGLSILESEICSPKISSTEPILPHESLCSEEENLLWHEYEKVFHHDRVVRTADEPGSFVRAITQLYRSAKDEHNEPACNALGKIFDSVRTGGRISETRRHVTLAGLITWLARVSSGRQIRLRKDIEHK